MEKIAILHLQKSIRRGQVDRLLKLKIEKGNGSLNEIKSKLKSRGYNVFSTISVGNKDTEAKIAEMGLPEHSTEALQRKLLHCLEHDVGLDISGCTELPQAVQMACEALKMLTMRSQILFTNIDDLQGDNKQYLTQIKALQVQTQGLTELHAAKLKVQQDQYKALKEQFENLRSRHSRLVRRESDTLSESSRRIEEWMTKFGMGD
jgi:hypothetical protein